MEFNGVDQSLSLASSWTWGGVISVELYLYATALGPYVVIFYSGNGNNVDHYQLMEWKAGYETSIDVYGKISFKLDSF